MSTYKTYSGFSGRIVIIGFGSIGQGTLPLILRHIVIPPERITIVTADDAGSDEATAYGVRFIKKALDENNFRQTLEPLVARGDFVLNLSVDVSSVALLNFCYEREALYLDTCIEPWPGGYTDLDVPAAKRTNYALREGALELRQRNKQAPTALITHGANPGLVSHFVKQALLNIARDVGMGPVDPRSREDWAALAQSLDIRTIHIAEQDTQVASVPKKPDEFVNTWSVDGFVSEGSQPCELGWGTHERSLPPEGRRHDSGSRAAIWLARPGLTTKVRSWTPLGPFHGFAITHGESISIADYLSVSRDGNAVYRPTVHYAYRPCDDAVLSIHELAGRNFVVQSNKRILMDEILPGGIDELGVLLAGHKKNAYWYGSQLSVDEARKLVPYNNATSLQVSITCLAGMVWVMENPDIGIVEPDDMDFRYVLEFCKPYLGPVVGAYTDWTPLTDRERLFPEDLDKADPWQFKNVRVT
jgi:homospermidine synthase